MYHNNKILKKRILELSLKYNLSHLSSNFTAVDIIQDIYNTKANKDLFVLSAGHCALAWYVVLERMGVCDAEGMWKKHGVHPNRDIENGLTASAGSLGHGIGIALGMALANRHRKVYCLISDGESLEGSVYEALGICVDYDVSNLEVYLNFNGYSAYSEMTCYPVAEAFPFVKIIKTRIGLPYLSGVDAHYKVLDTKEGKMIWEELCRS